MVYNSVFSYFNGHIHNIYLLLLYICSSINVIFQMCYFTLGSKVWYQITVTMRASLKMVLFPVNWPRELINAEWVLFFFFEFRDFSFLEDFLDLLCTGGKRGKKKKKDFFFFWPPGYYSRCPQDRKQTFLGWPEFPLAHLVHHALPLTYVPPCRSDNTMK